MKKLIFSFLRIASKLVLKKYKPKVIGVTGSVGKTTAKNAIYKVLKKDFNSFSSKGSFNTEIGLPLTILKLETSKSLLYWIGNFFKILKLIIFKDKSYPEVLILEMGADNVGDISYLNTIAPTEIAVLTEVSGVHLEGFGSLDAVYKEKTNIFRAKQDQICILNIDSEYISKKYEELKKELNGKRFLTYGFNKNADVFASEIVERIDGLSFKLFFDNKTDIFHIKNILGKHMVYSVLAAIAVGLAMGMDIKQMKKTLKFLELEKGRMSLIQGIKGCVIIDDTYNSSPLACKAALKTLAGLKTKGNKIAVLGDMLELGDFSKKAHLEVGEFIASLNAVDMLVTYGSLAKNFSHNLSEKKVFSFDDIDKLQNFLKEKVKREDLVLIKGSQGMRMENITKALMKDPSKAYQLLVRQKGIWRNK